MIRKFVLGVLSVLLVGCQAVVQEPQAIPSTELKLEEIKFVVIEYNNEIFYALDSRNYANLSVNMIRIQEFILRGKKYEAIQGRSHR